MQRIRQAISKECLFEVLKRWLTEGAGRDGRELQILSAFASGRGVRALEPLLDIFLADGNSIVTIVGIDRNGTDKSAVHRLASLRSAYPGQFQSYVFHAPSREAIFHPKLFLLRQPRKVSAVIGSGNWTVGGMATNFESLFLYEGLATNSPEALELAATWATFAQPSSPVKPTFLKPLTHAYAQELAARLPSSTPWEVNSAQAKSRELWRPLSRINLPRTQSPLMPRHRSHLASRPGALLLVDILNETRSTQMQIPLNIVEDFFETERDQPATIKLRVITSEGFGQPIDRPLVISQGAKGRRLMRRLEMPSIRGLDRPLAGVFLRSKGSSRTFAYRLLPNDTKLYHAADRLLTEFGQQGQRDRRYVIADKRHPAFDEIHKILKQW